MRHKIFLMLGVFFAIFCVSSVVPAQPPFQVTHESSDLTAMTFAWSPDGTQFVYTALCDDEVKLYRINWDGTNKILLADSVMTGYGGPVDWKGSDIVFKAIASSGTYPYNMLLRRIDPDGTNEKTLYGPYWYGDLVLRSGGNWLLFREAPLGWWIAKRIDMNGSNVQTVSHSKLVQGIGWLGKSHILYTQGSNYFTPCKLYSVDFNGANLATLTPVDLVNNAQFSASPDSSKILYCNGTSANWDIWIMDSDGSNKNQLTFHPKFDYLSWPLQNVWSSDYQSFFLVSRRSSKGDIYKMNIDGTGLTQITFSDSLDVMPNVSPDGKKLAFLSNRDGNTNIWVIDFEKVHVFAPDTTEEGNKTIEIPIRVTDLTNKGVYSFGMTIETDPNILVPKDVITTGTLTESWGPATHNINGGKIQVAHAGFTPLAGSGTLIYVQYQVPPTVAHNATTRITMTDIIFNDGQPESVVHNGSFTVIWEFDVSGNIKYYSNDIPLPNVDVSLDGHQMTTGNNGDFEFLDIPYGDYTLHPEKTGDASHAIGPYDAALILLSTVQLITLTPYQMIAADVTGSGTISGFDASYVLRYYVGLEPEFPVEKDWTFVPLGFPISTTNWSSAPDSIRYEPLNADKTDQDFAGIVYGDVSGNWQLPAATPGQWLAHSNSQPKLLIDKIQKQKNGNFTIPVVIADVSDLVAIGLSCQYDQHQLQFIAAELTSTSAMSPMIFSKDNNGTIRLGIATAHSIKENSVTINLHFKPNNSIEQIKPGSFSIQELSVNGNTFQVNSGPIETEFEPVLPEQYDLSQNYPNPFNSETLVKYQLPKSEFLTIKIYNLLGQKIRTLVAEDKEAGYYQIIWNGRDDWNQQVGSGEYLCQMRSGDFIAVRKVVLIR